MARGKDEANNPRRRPIIKMYPEAVEKAKDAYAYTHPFEDSETEERAMRQLKKEEDLGN